MSVLSPSVYQICQEVSLWMLYAPWSTFFLAVVVTYRWLFLVGLCNSRVHSHACQEVTHVSRVGCLRHHPSYIYLLKSSFIKFLCQLSPIDDCSAGEWSLRQHFYNFLITSCSSTSYMLFLYPPIMGFCVVWNNGRSAIIKRYQNVMHKDISADIHTYIQTFGRTDKVIYRGHY